MFRNDNTNTNDNNAMSIGQFNAPFTDRIVPPPPNPSSLTIDSQGFPVPRPVLSRNKQPKQKKRSRNESLRHDVAVTTPTISMNLDVKMMDDTIANEDDAMILQDPQNQKRTRRKGHFIPRC